MGSMFNLSRISNIKKKRKKKGPSRKDIYAQELNNNLPASEVWFQNKWNQDVIQNKYTMYQDRYNSVFGKYIPDVLNRGYKYIIEIDGSIHDTPEQQWKDRLKDAYYIKRGYSVFRIKAFDEASYKEALFNILNIRDKNKCPY